MKAIHNYNSNVRLIYIKIYCKFNILCGLPIAVSGIT